MKEKIKYIIISLLVIFLMSIATFKDLSIAENIYNPNAIWAHIFKVVGEFPIYVGLFLFGITYFHLTSNKTLKSLLLIETFISVFLFIIMPARYLFDVNIISGVIITLISLLLFFLVMKLSYKVKTEKYEKIKLVSLIYFLGILSQLSITYFMKSMWSRNRFLELGENMEFTKWYVINWFDGSGTSFPSGHTAGATNIMYLTLFTPLFTNDKKKHVLVECLCFLFIGVTALSRMFLGKHYLSDVTAAFAIVYVIHIIVSKSIIDRQRKKKSI